MTDFFNSIPPGVIDAIGVAGFGLYVFNYTALTFHKVTSCSTAYFAINLLASSFVLIGLMQSFNLAAAMIQVFWIVISIAAIVLRLRGSPRVGASPHNLQA